jgi:class 3 adenylate cyclase
VLLLLTDTENSSAHWEADEATMSEQVAHHDELIAAAVARAGRTFLEASW